MKDIAEFCISVGFKTRATHVVQIDGGIGLGVELKRSKLWLFLMHYIPLWLQTIPLLYTVHFTYVGNQYSTQGLVTATFQVSLFKIPLCAIDFPPAFVSVWILILLNACAICGASFYICWCYFNYPASAFDPEQHFKSCEKKHQLGCHFCLYCNQREENSSVMM